MNKLFKILCCVGLFAMMPFASHAETSIKATLDSASLLMGKQTVIHLEIVQDVLQQGKIINEPSSKADTIISIVQGVEFVGVVRNDTTDIGNNLSQINRDYAIQSFDSGLYTIPPFRYVIGIDTIETNALTLKVLPVQVDSLLTEINDYSSIELIEQKWYDFMPDWVIDNWGLILVVILIIIGAVALYYLYRANGNSILPKKKRIPPYELAKQKLSKLKKQNLCEKGCEKEYYTLLTEILREYLSGRFGISALEMTSKQILDAIENSAEIKNYKHNISEILGIADFVKFAKIKPTTDENKKSFSGVSEFVENTKPIVEDNKNNNDVATKQNYPLKKNK